MTQEKWHYYTLGAGNPLVFIHGALGFAGNFHSIAKALKDSHHSLLYDQRGHGKSLKSAPHTLLQLTEDLRHLIDLFQKSVPVSIVGHSLGGYVALLFARKHPDRLKKLIVVDSSPRPSAESLQDIRLIVEKLPESFPDPKAAKRFFKLQVQQKVFSETLSRFFQASLYKTFNGLMKFAFHKAAVLSFCEDLRRYDFHSILKTLKLPVLILRGEHSSVFLKEDFEKLKKLNPAFVTAKQIPESGHWLHQEQKKLFIETTKHFLL